MTLDDLDELIVRVVCEIEFCRSRGEKERYDLWVEAHDKLLGLRTRKAVRDVLSRQRIR